MCIAINNTIEDFIENAEEYIEDIKEHEYYEQFVSFREQSKKKKNRRMPMSKVIAIANQKGGVGKTTTTFSLGVALAKQGKRVLKMEIFDTFFGIIEVNS